MANVQLDHLKKTYPNGVTAVEGASIEVKDGEFVVLVGPSGCGKSTLLRMVAGLETITEGTLRIGDRVVNDLDPADRDIAMVFQNYALYPHMNVYNNMAYGLRNRGTPKAEIDSAVRKAAATLNLLDYLERRPSQLSGGQRQRVAMGRAIVRDPALFLFDEPLSNLDAKLRNQMRIEVRKLQKSLGTTSLYVTHDQVEAMTMADRIVVMNAGRIEQIGTPAEIYHRPQSVFVASFMGAPPMNIFDAVNVAGQIESPDLGTLNVNHASKHGTKLAIGLRPEQIRLSAKANGITRPFTVEYVEELGAARTIHGRIGEMSVIVNVPHDTELPQDTLYAAIEPDRFHIFDAATGLRMN